MCKRDGVLLAEPLQPPAADVAGLAYWQKLVVYTGERTRNSAVDAVEHQPLHSALVAPPAPGGRGRRDRAARAVGLPRRRTGRTASASGHYGGTCRC